ncbi:phage tail tube protein [Serratia symbiotica]|uniref:phage tail tube protein n=1 Tax=Serratia symbiotica TaxID=138074 RepID=UPI001DDCD242|nr:phage tail tube protein [Serratia symbiotica]MCX2957531.1 phage tail tube protein [Serratia symbiotica]NIG87323.1 phage tail protein [Serratia symbiotica]USS96782.1 phage tail tube protein [Serratia symbiotica]
MTGKRRIGGTCYFKVDGQQLSLNGSVEVPMNTVIREDLVGIDGSVHYKETHRAPYIKAEFKVERSFPIEKLTTADEMTITAELANGMVYVLSAAWLSGEYSHNADEGTVEMEFHGNEGFYQ